MFLRKDMNKIICLDLWQKRHVAYSLEVTYYVNQDAHFYSGSLAIRDFSSKIMAELVGGALLSAFLDPLVEKLAKEVKDFFKGKDVILKLVKDLKTLLSMADLLLIDAEEKLIKDHKVRNWLDDLKDAIYHADDLVHMINTEALRNELEGESQTGCTCSNKVLMKLIPTPFTAFDKAMKSEIQQTLGKVKLLLENKDLGLERLKKQKFPERVCAPSLEESDIYGRSDEKEEIVKLLLSNDMAGGDKLSVIPIVGMGGIGKTTLAQLVYKDERVNNMFDTKVWITVGDDKVDCLKVMKLIAEKVTCEKCEIEEVYDLQEEVKKALSVKRFFFVVDDVWDEDPTKWDVLENCFKSGLDGSKIIVTTRSTTVASIMKTWSTYQLKGINEVDGWLLFAKHASINANSNEYSDLEETGKRIVDKCKGLPLAIKSLGDLLRGKQNKEEWDNILINDIWELYENNQVSVLPALWLSYFYLPSELKQCFAYCSLFPKDHHFVKREMVLLWMAECLLHSTKNKKRVEDIGDEYFQDLISKSFFQPSGEEEDDEPTYIMHNLIHDLAMFICGEFCLTMNVSKCSDKVRHMSNMQDWEVVYDFTQFENSSKAKYLRTLILSPQKSVFDRAWLPKLEQAHKSFPRLRVLSIKNDLITKFPDSIGNLKYLRYLKLDCSDLEEIPGTICNLYNLEILLFDRCNFVTRLATSVGNLINLRHLRVPDSFNEMPLQFDKLKNLQTLNRFIMGKNKGSSIKLLKDLQDLHGSLFISGLENVTSVEEASEVLKNKKSLSELYLEWDYDDGHEPGDLDKEREILSALEPSPNLKELTIDGYKGIYFPSWIRDHHLSLVRVTLKDCPNCSFLPLLGQLPSLKDIDIDGLEGVVRIGSEFYYSAAVQAKPFFRSLESLKLDRMKQLQEWSLIEGGVFPRLRNLCLDFCRKLKVSLLPDYFPSLRMLRIKYCEQVMPLLPRAQYTHPLFPCLEILTIDGCDGVEVLLEGGLPLSLKNIRIIRCKDLKSLDEQETFQRLTSLEKLHIEDCRNLIHLPRELPTSLSDLSIISCELLTPRLQRDTGEDWSIIAHIPNVTIDRKKV
ncbi:putative disease resistance RPP13-like protein 1 [Humulus lupulus]|uniref:putative disease resistance RPP13-like protein 1 n=1 Tax=Humulus lupulus TaxID=3486 RepID=UPI002B403566|nr:putative disease resistance RPP13-like protein 1 [Humulus lupulus]XP_062115545.1 putative disease resistance RPP13-like protein 1 [Humulus lupulus]XP_062115546.1 putative disease resistance RPP13-like protein 1 [Humulus lupulus]